MNIFYSNHYSNNDMIILIESIDLGFLIKYYSFKIFTIIFIVFKTKQKYTYLFKYIIKVVNLY